ncbi:putative membrane protein, partial [Vibrio harveyi]
IFW